ncbi:MAG: hypothetical protein ACOYJH_02330 [Anaerovoracaceae bacterium]|jgi:epoxyqueuosine reductase
MALTSEKVKELAAQAGAHGCGIASIDRFGDAPEGFSPLDVFSGCKSVCVVFRTFPHGALLAENLISYTHAAYRMYEEMDRVLMELSRLLEREGVLAAIVPPDTPYLYWDPHEMRGQGIISLKHAAVQAGLGIMGRNTILITPEYGNMVYLGALLLDTELEPDPLIKDFGCPEKCHHCVDICPVHAIHDGTVEQKRCRPNSNFKNERGFDLYACNRCRVECPLRFGRLDRKDRPKLFKSAVIADSYKKSVKDAEERRKKYEAMEKDK